MTGDPPPGMLWNDAIGWYWPQPIQPFTLTPFIMTEEEKCPHCNGTGKRSKDIE
jgi:hypothetical protein